MKKCFMLMIFVLLLAGGNVHATPVQWSVNGHYYEIVYVDEGITWEDAKALAESMSYNGLQGHLATITSAAENYFISYDSGLGNGDFDSVWLGGYQEEGSEEPAGGWTWITGEAFIYNNWAGGEPNNSPDGENALTFQHSYTNDGKQWNDYISTLTQSGYVVEYEAVPEPASLLLLALGLLGVIPLKKSKIC